MGKRNLAIVGTQQDFFADIFDDRTGVSPAVVTGCASCEDAATSYFRNVFENSNGRVQLAAIAVRPVADGSADWMIFDATAIMTPCENEDAEPGEYDVFLKMQRRN